MHRVRVELVVFAIILLGVPVCWAGGPEAAVSGLVRDTQGVAQMGALVQVLASDARLVGTTYTDFSGHYSLRNLVPGRYRVQASAALFSPSVRENVRLPMGARAVVDLTLGAMFDAGGWIPAERRRADEPSDEWKWTLRSAANRPVLRMDDDGAMVLVSSSATESSRPSQHATAGVGSGDGGFGLGGLHHRLSFDQALVDGSDVVLRGDVGGEQGRAPSEDLEAGYQRRVGFGGAARTVVSFQTHPEMLSTDGIEGVQTLRLASAERTRIGDLIDLEYGSELTALRVGGVGLSNRPFVRILVHPSGAGATGWAVGYRMATSRDLQAYDALDSLDESLPVAALAAGRLAVEKGLHQELSVARTDGRGLVQLAVYHDAVERAGLAGMGVLTAGDLRDPGVQGLLVDTATHSFRLLSGGYGGDGFRLTVSEPLTQSLSAAFSVASGVGLAANGSGTESLQDAGSNLTPRAGDTATIALKGRVLHTGTKVRAAYRWQPRRMVTAVDPYAPFSDQAYLSFYLAQPLRFGGALPAGLEMVVDVTNLLGQGYQPFLSRDRTTVFLAQSPRVIQAGLSYKF